LQVHRVGYGAMVALFFTVWRTAGHRFFFYFFALLGVAVASAVLAHKFSDGMTLSTLFLNSTHSLQKTLALVVALSLATPLGVGLGMSAGTWASGTVLATLLGLAAGGFSISAWRTFCLGFIKAVTCGVGFSLVAGVGVSVLLPHP
jgi:zinc transporter ZupT